MEVGISDHKPVFINKKGKRSKHRKKVIASRNYTNYNKELFGNVLLDSHRWQCFWKMQHDDPNLLWGIMVDVITASIDVLCPKREIVIREDQLPWVDKQLRQELGEKNKTYKRACLTQSSFDWEAYNDIKKTTRRLLIKKKRDYITLKLDENRDEPRAFWRELDTNLRVGKNKSPTTSCERIRDVKGNIVTGKEVSETLNSFYVNVGQELARKFPHCDPKQPTYMDVRRQCNFRFVDMPEVNSVIKALNKNKSTGIPDVNMTICKDALSLLLLEFTYLINECLDQSVMPTEWKAGTVTPVPKGIPTLNMGDYRPISVLPAASKVIERVVYNQLIYYLECNGLLDHRQHGFRKDHSTVSAIFELTQFLYGNLDQGNVSHCVFIDYSKAFDTINHDILCNKLVVLGFDRQIVSWCQNYLTNRTQCVKTGDYVSPRLDINCGVPQGSILGPLFFIIYVNDLLELFDPDAKVQITLYADDTVLYVSDKCSSNAATTLNDGLNKLAEWCVINKLTINVKKTKHMLISPPNAPITPEKIILNGTQLDTVRNYNYLGVLIDDGMTFDMFLSDKYNKVNMRVHQLRKLRKYITSQVANRIYKQTILPIVEYADLMVESGPADKVTRLQGLQDKALQIIDNNKEPNLDMAGLSFVYKVTPLKLRRAEHLGVFMYRLSKRNKYIEKSRPNINLRSRKKIKFKNYNRRYEKYLKSPFSRGVTLWDRIPELVQRSTTKVKFKRDITPFLEVLIKPVLR